MSKSRMLRVLAFATVGGLLFQAGGCATVLAPLALSVGESILLSFLTGGIAGGF